MSIARFLMWAPRNALALAEQSTRGALSNALQAAQEVLDSVAERTALTDAVQRDGEPEPGDLRRLSRAECLDLLGSRQVGRLAYVARAGVPDIVPVNYAVDGEDVLIRSGPGPKLQAAERRELVAFEVDDIDEEGRTGWSVVVVGRAHKLTSAEQGSHVARGAVPQPWASGTRRHEIRISPKRIDGRRLT